MTTVDLKSIFDARDAAVRSELASKPEVVDCGDDLDLTKVAIEARRWLKARDVVVVFADLKNSTQLGLNKHAASTASIYEAAITGAVKIFGEFDVDYTAIHGDGAFGLFWGAGRKSRAVCAAITVKTFSQKILVPQLEKKWETLPETGFKIGVSHSSLLIKKVGIPRTDHKEFVWPGKAVNYAAKCAQQADRGEMIVSGGLWDWVSKNDYLAVSCACGAPSSDIWQDVTIEKIPDEDGEREGKLLTAVWCDTHGAEYCNRILGGNRRRADVTTEREDANKVEMQKSIRRIAEQRRAQQKARINGLR